MLEKMLTDKPQPFDFLTAEGRQRKKDFAIALRYQHGLDEFKKTLEPHHDAIRALPVGTQLKLKSSDVHKYHESTPGSWHRNISVYVERDEKNDIKIVANKYYSNYVQYHTGRSYRDRDERYHQLDHETHAITLNDALGVVAVESGSKHEVIGDFVSDPWEQTKYLAQSEPIISMEKQADVLERVSGLL